MVEVALRDLASDRLLFREKLHDKIVRHVTFSPDGRWMASTAGLVIRLRRVDGPAQAGRDFTARPGAALRRVEVRVLKDVQAGEDHPLGIVCPAFTPDGTRLVAGTADDATLFIWRIEDGQLLRTIPGRTGRRVRRITPSCRPWR